MPLKVSDGIGAWIKDFQKSDAPQFKGKDKEERRDMAVAAYLSAKRGPLKDEQVRQEAMTAQQKAELDRQKAAFMKRGGKVKKLPPGKAAGYHGKDDPGAGMRGMLDRGDSKAFGTRKKVKSMGALRNSYVWEAMDPKMRKVRQLATLGLVGKSDVNKLMIAMKDISAGKEVKPNQRKIIFDAFGDLIDLVTGDTQVFQKAKKKVKEEVIYEDKDPNEYDNEGEMMKDHLDIVMDAADEMYDMVTDQENLPEWVQSKITKAADYLDSSRDYLMSQKRDKPSDATNEAINHADAHRDAQQHSDGSMSVKKIPSMIKKPSDKHLHLHMKSYHKEKDGQDFAKKHGYKVSNYVKTPAGSRMDIHKESKVNEISKSTAMSYISKAARDVYHKGQQQGTKDAISRLGGPSQDYKKSPERKAAKRVAGIDRATRRIAKKEDAKNIPEKTYSYFDTKDAAAAHVKKHGGKMMRNTGKGATTVKGVPKNQFVVIKAAVTSADRKPQNVTGPDGKVRVRMVPMTKKSESTIAYGKAMIKKQRDQKKAMITPKDKNTLGKLAALMAKQPKRQT